MALLGMVANLVATTSLMGCKASDNAYKVDQTGIEITWENDEIVSGTIPYDDIIGHIKVVILEQNGTIEPFLMIKERKFYGRGISYLSYRDLKNGNKWIEYYYNNSSINGDLGEPTEILIGKQITILEEQEFYDYLFDLGEIRSELDITEITDIYDNKVESQLIEYIKNEYGYKKILEN